MLEKSRSRALGSLALCLGIAGLSAGLTLPHFYDSRAVLPLDASQTTWTITDEHAQTRLVQDGRQLSVPVTAQWHLSVHEPADANSASIQIGSSWMRSSQQAEPERLINAQVWSYSLDRYTGQALSDATLTHTVGYPTTTVPISGVWFKFPSNVEKTTYEVFDDTLRTTAPAVFEEELEISGHKVYRFHQEISPTNVALLYAGYFNSISVAGPDDTQETAYLYHSATKDIYVDQATGLVVDLDLKVKDFYGDLNGVEKENSLSFSGSISEEDTAQLISQAEHFHKPKSAQALQWALIIGGALLSVLAVLILAWAARADRATRP